MDIAFTLADMVGILMWAGLFYAPVLVFVWILSLPSRTNQYALKPKAPAAHKVFLYKKALIVALIISLALSTGTALVIKTNTGVFGDHAEST